MAYKVLYRKYRPQDFNGLYGQDNIKELLVDSIKNNKISHAYLFSGPRGTGKTSTAKLFAKAINCENSKDGVPCGECVSCKNYEESPDIIEIDAASNNGVDEMRDLRDNAKILPTFCKYRIYIIDEVHMLSTQAWNAFLKILEEPPVHVIFILATTEIQKVPITILSRCQRFSFKRITKDVIVNNIIDISKKEDIKITDEAAQTIAELADGGMRDALSMLDQLSKENKEITDELIGKIFGVVGLKEIKCLIESVISGDINGYLNTFDTFSSMGLDSNLFISQLIKVLFEIEVDNHNNNSGMLSSDTIKKISLELANCYYKKDAIDLVKVILLSYMKNTNNVVNESKIISREIISEQKTEICNSETDVLEEKKDIKETPVINEEKLNNDVITKANEIVNETVNENKEIMDKLVNIRINNSFCGADKELKKSFSSNWKKYVSEEKLKHNSEIISIIEDVTVQVVSGTNVLFSCESLSTSILFNNNYGELEKEYNKMFKTKYSFICIDENRWNQEAKMFVLNKGKKEYSYIKEEISKKKKSSRTIDSAMDIFEDNIIEVN